RTGASRRRPVRGSQPGAWVRVHRAGVIAPRSQPKHAVLPQIVGDGERRRYGLPLAVRVAVTQQLNSNARQGLSILVNHRARRRAWGDQAEIKVSEPLPGRYGERSARVAAALRPVLLTDEAVLEGGEPILSRVNRSQLESSVLVGGRVKGFPGLSKGCEYD